MKDDSVSDWGTPSREGPRIEASGIAWLWLDDSGSYVTGYLSNLSTGGMFVTLTEPPSEGASLRFELNLMATAAPVRGTGVVAWRRWSYDGPSKPPGAGIRFLAFEEGSEHSLELALEAAGEAPASGAEPADALSDLAAVLQDVEGPRNEVEAAPREVPRDSGSGAPWRSPPAAALEVPNIPDRRRAWPEHQSLATRGRRPRVAAIAIPVLAVAGLAAIALAVVKGWGAGETSGERAQPEVVVEVAAGEPIGVIEPAASGPPPADASSVEPPAAGPAAAAGDQGATTEEAVPAARAPVASPPTARSERAPARLSPVIEEQPAVPLPPLSRVRRIEVAEGRGATRVALVGDGTLRADRVRISRIGGEAPRAVIQVTGISELPETSAVSAATAQVTGVRTGLHAGGVLHVVIDLTRADLTVSEPQLDGSTTVFEIRSP